jgi:hypothetical protein
MARKRQQKTTATAATAATVPAATKYVAALCAHYIAYMREGGGIENLPPAARRKVERRERLGLPLWVMNVMTSAAFDGLSLARAYARAAQEEGWRMTFREAVEAGVRAGVLASKAWRPGGLTTLASELRRAPAPKARNDASDAPLSDKLRALIPH